MRPSPEQIAEITPFMQRLQGCQQKLAVDAQPQPLQQASRQIRAFPERRTLPPRADQYPSSSLEFFTNAALGHRTCLKNTHSQQRLERLSPGVDAGLCLSVHFRK